MGNSLIKAGFKSKVKCSSKFIYHFLAQVAKSVGKSLATLELIFKQQNSQIKVKMPNLVPFYIYLTYSKSIFEAN